MPNDQVAIIGRKAIAKYYGWSLPKLDKRMHDLKKAGVTKKIKIGRAGHQRRVVIAALPSLLDRFWVECL